MACTYGLPLVGRQGRKNRTAVMELRFKEVSVTAPSSASSDSPRELKVWCIYTCERSESVPEGEKPVEWRAGMHRMVQDEVERGKPTPRGQVQGICHGGIPSGNWRIHDKAYRNDLRGRP